MDNEIKVNKANKSITFINNGIAFSQFGVADEILDLITNLQEENRQTKILKERYQLEKEVYKSRNEKAVEYINTHYLSANEPDLLNILTGGDER